MEILSFIYDVIARSCRLSKAKQQKYIDRINDILKSDYIKRKNLEKIVGNLTYAAWVAPFGRPFLSVLSSKITPASSKKPILVSAPMKNALVVRKMILTKNLGLSYKFILGRLPYAKNE